MASGPVILITTFTIVALLFFLGGLIYYLVTSQIDTWFWVFFIIGILLIIIGILISIFLADLHFNALEVEIQNCRSTNPNYVRAVSTAYQPTSYQPTRYQPTTQSVTTGNEPQVLAVPSTRF